MGTKSAQMASLESDSDRVVVKTPTSAPTSATSAVLAVVALIALFLAPLVGNKYIIFLITLILINVISVQGLNFLIGYTGQLSLGHGAFVALGAYLTAILCNTYSASFWVVIVIVPLATGLVGVLVALPALRLKGLYLAMVTLAFHMVVSLGLMSLDDITGGYQGMAVPNPRLGSVVFNTEGHFYYLALLCALLIYAASANVARSKFYRGFIAVKEKEISAQAMGISLWYYKTLAFLFASIYGGLAGCLFAVTMGHVTPNHFPMMMSIEFIMMITVGGPGSFVGLTIGASLITLLPYFLLYAVQEMGTVVPSVVVYFADIKIVIYGLVLVGSLMFLPGGLYGLKAKVQGWLAK
jgi:branched-chain amino acid transport system permease protein